MKKIQTTAIESLQAATQLHEKQLGLFKKNLELTLGFVTTSSNVASTLVAQYTCPESQMTFTFCDLMAWCDYKDIMANGVEANALGRWDEGLSFNPKQVSHEGITVLSTKAEMTEAMEDLSYCLDEMSITDFIPDWKQQVVAQVTAFHAANNKD